MAAVAATVRSCCLVDCADATPLADSGRVEVEIPAAEAAAAAAEADGPTVRWEPGGQASFHPACWELIEKRLKGRRGGRSAERRALAEAAETAEHHAAPAQVAEAAAGVAALLREAGGRAVVFSGAGISTAAGVGDYRGKSGKWTKESQGRDEPYETEYEQLRPTFTHHAVAKLLEDGLLSRVITQNADGLHLLSGVPAESLSSLHGDAFTEYCVGCGTEYARPYYAAGGGGGSAAEEYFAGRLAEKPAHVVQCRGCKSNHWTGRVCEKAGCGGKLHDTIISFGDSLRDCVVEAAASAASEATVVLSLGSTMSVSPANQLVTLGGAHAVRQRSQSQAQTIIL
jgi:mono-ADP-ribosyltransferase sirtuin 6